MKEKRGIENKKANSRFVSLLNKTIPPQKRSQLTIFIILAVLLLIILILLISRTDLKTFFIAKTPVQEIEDCAKENINQGVKILSLQGGSINPENYYLYEGNKVEYVCYTQENLKTCIMQKPLLKSSIEDELEKFSEQKIKDCIKNVEQNLEKKGYEVSTKTPNITLELIPDNILVNIDLNLKISKDTVETYNNVKTGIKSKLYNFVMIASSIMSFEARYGDSETLNYMIYYPSIKVEKKKQGDGSKIYILTDNETGEKFMFAVRSIAIPPGVIEVR